MSALWLTLETLAPEGRQLPYPDVRSTVNFNHAYEPILASYRLVEDMARRGETEGLKAFVNGAPESFLRYRALLLLARDARVPMAQRAEFYEQAFSARLLEPLARSEVRSAHLEYARVAELAGQTRKALDAYLQAFPLPAAGLGIARLAPQPEERARLLMRLGAYTEAQEVLERAPNHNAPLLEAQIYRGAGHLEAALSAYDRVLERSPDHLGAQTERAWVLLSLDRLEEAETAFAALSSPARERGLGAAAATRGAFSEAAERYRHYAQRSSDPEGLWLATEMLERADQAYSALPLYLELAQQPSPFQLDAAYRALVLAERQGDAAGAQLAAARLPRSSYFGVLQHGLPTVPQRSRLQAVRSDVLLLAEALARSGDEEAARGELLIALENAREDEAATATLAGALQALGEFRRSAQAANRWVERGSRDRRTWELAYPRAYANTVLQYAALWDVEPALIWAVMRQESAFYPRAVSTSEAKGLMQIVPTTWTWLGELLEEPSSDPFDVADNIRYGTFYLSHLQNTFGGNLERTVAAYNGGPGYIRSVEAVAPVNQDPKVFYRFIERQETREYLQKVMFNYTIYRQLSTAHQQAVTG